MMLSWPPLAGRSTDRGIAGVLGKWASLAPAQATRSRPVRDSTTEAAGLVLFPSRSVPLLAVSRSPEVTGRLARPSSGALRALFAGSGRLTDKQRRGEDGEVTAPTNGAQLTASERQTGQAL